MRRTFLGRVVAGVLLAGVGLADAHAQTGSTKVTTPTRTPTSTSTGSRVNGAQQDQLVQLSRSFPASCADPAECFMTVLLGDTFSPSLYYDKGRVAAARSNAPMKLCVGGTGQCRDIRPNPNDTASRGELRQDTEFSNLTPTLCLELSWPDALLRSRPFVLQKTFGRQPPPPGCRIQ